MEQEGKRDIRVTLAVLLVVVLIVGGAIVFAKKKSNSAMADTTVQTAPAKTSTGAAVTASTTFTDGTYNANSTYDSPGGNQSIAVSITLKDGIVTDTSVQGQANDGDARQYQADFVNAYKPLVVGKKITDIKLSRVSGSSLTSQGFNNALQQIESQAAKG